MSKYVVSVAIISMNKSKDGFTVILQTYDVTSIGNRVNATLQCHTDDIKKRFELDSFNKMKIESDLDSCRASIKFLVNDISDVDVVKVVDELKEKLLDNMRNQLMSFEKYIEKILYQEEYRLVKSKEI